MGYLSYWLLLWMGTAEAANGAEFADTMLAIPPMAWLLTFIAAGLGGVISVLDKMRKVPPAIDMSVAALAYSMMWSIVAGLIGFLSALALRAPAEAIPIAVFGCAFVGRPIVDLLGWLMRTWIKKKGDDAPPAS